MSEVRPPEVDSFAGALSEWLASFTMPESLAGEMANVCSGGAPWPAAIGGSAVRRSGWGDAESLIWGIAVGALAGGLEGASTSLGTGVDVGRMPGTAVDGAAGTLLAADGLVAAAHEALGSLGPDRLEIVMGALDEEFGDGGPWGRLGRVGGVAWPVIVPLALMPAARSEPQGPWSEYATAWRSVYGSRGSAGEAGDSSSLWNHPAADDATRALMQAATDQAREVQTNLVERLEAR
ncbi:MAG: hypothetical protein P8Y29_06550 [Gemmatimonadota bacterium]